MNNDSTTDTRFDYDITAATDGSGNWVAVWTGTGPGNDDDIFLARSSDDGVTWTNPATLNSNAAIDFGDQDQSPSIATDGAGTWVTVWRGDGTDLPQPGFSDIIISRSTDNGVSWTPVQRIDLGLSADVGNDLNPKIVTDGSGTWIVVWAGERLPGPEFDIVFARSTNGGVSWTAPATLNSYGATDNSPDSAPTLATDNNGTWVVAWNSPATPPNGQIGSDNDIWIARSIDGGATWSTASRANPNAATDSGVDEVPSIAMDSLGNCMLSWQSNGILPDGNFGDDRDILVMASKDHCTTWDLLCYANLYAASDPESDTAPSVAYVKPGRALIAWSAANTPTGNASNDLDVLGSILVQTNIVPAVSFSGIAALAVALSIVGTIALGPNQQRRDEPCK